jgi:hypothetical protein
MVVARTEVAVEPGCVCCVWVWVSGWLGPQPWPGD